MPYASEDYLNRRLSVVNDKIDTSRPFLQDGLGAVVRTVDSKLKDVVFVEDFGAVGGGTVDDSDAIQNAINSSAVVYLLPKLYRVDKPIEVHSGKKLIGVGATLYRPALSNSSLPVVYLLDSYSELYGVSLYTEKNSENGILCLGHKSNLDTRNCQYWKAQNIRLFGNGADGSFGFIIPSGQLTYPDNSNYFGFVDSITINNVDFGCRLYELANAHNLSNLVFSNCKTANISLQGAYANNFTNIYFHGGSKNGCISIQILNKVNGLNHNSDFNNFTNFTAETGGSNDLCFLIESECEGNTLIGTSNVAGGFIYNNYRNTIIVNELFLIKGNYSFVKGIKSNVPTVASKINLTSGLFLISISNQNNPNLCRSDLLLLSIRTSLFAPSSFTVISSTYNDTGLDGEPISVIYSLDTFNGNTTPSLLANITTKGPQTNFVVNIKSINI